MKLFKNISLILAVIIGCNLGVLFAGKPKKQSKTTKPLNATGCALSGFPTGINYNSLIDTVFYSFKASCNGSNNTSCAYAAIFRLFKNDGEGHYYLVNTGCTSGAWLDCGENKVITSAIDDVFKDYGSGDYIVQVGLYSGTCDNLGGLVAWEMLEF